MKLNNALLNSGLPQMVNKKEFAKDDIKTIEKQMKSLDNYYKNSYKQSETRKTLINYINNYCVACRWYSLIIE